jgi:hypothetical protein
MSTHNPKKKNENIEHKIKKNMLCKNKTHNYKMTINNNKK